MTFYPQLVQEAGITALASVTETGHCSGTQETSEELYILFTFAHAALSQVPQRLHE